LFGISKHKYYTYSNLVEGILNLVLSLWLVRRYGILGVAMGTGIPMAVMGIFVQPWYVCHAISLNVRTYVSNILIHSAIASVFLGIGYLVTYSRVEANYLNLVLCGLVHATIYGSGVLFAGFSPSDRTFFWNVLRQAVAFGKKPLPRYAEVHE
jgi:O-antigen/teichoic acid export membrane protein